jgi:hypothetical protein
MKKKFSIIIILIVLLGFLVLVASNTSEDGIYGAIPNPTGNPVGGGAGYNRIITQLDPQVKVVVTNKEGLISSF